MGGVGKRRVGLRLVLGEVYVVVWVKVLRAEIPKRLSVFSVLIQKVLILLFVSL